MTWVWLAAGLAAGGAHAILLWRTSARPAAWSPLSGLVRLGGVAAVLAGAALCGGILPAAAGWVAGLAILGAALVLSHRPAAPNNARSGE